MSLFVLLVSLHYCPLPPWALCSCRLAVAIGHLCLSAICMYWSSVLEGHVYLQATRLHQHDCYSRRLAEPLGQLQSIGLLYGSARCTFSSAVTVGPLYL